MKTACRFCLFNINNGHSQTGCQLDRLVKYESTIIDGYHELDGYCNHFRNCYSDVALADDPISAVKKECEIKYGVIYSYDQNFESLAKTLKSAKGIHEPLDFIVCFDDKVDVNLQQLYNDSSSILPQVIVSQSIDDDMNWFNTYEMGMKKTNADYIYFCDCGHEIDKNCLAHLNSLVNDDVKSVYMIVGENFSIVYKKLFLKFAYLEQPMRKLYNALITNEKLKDGVIKWLNNEYL